MQNLQNSPFGALLMHYGQMEKFILDQCCVLSTLNLQGHCHLYGRLGTLTDAIYPNETLFFFFLASVHWGERKGKKSQFWNKILQCPFCLCFRSKPQTSFQKPLPLPQTCLLMDRIPGVSAQNRGWVGTNIHPAIDKACPEAVINPWVLGRTQG